MASFWEPEEAVGTLWHRLVGASASYRSHPQAAVELAQLRPRLVVIFRALGGAGAVRLAAGHGEVSRHRRSLIQRVGLAGEKLEQARFDGVVLQLPRRIDVFADRADNAALYEWLVTFFALAPPPAPLSVDPLQADLARLRRARQVVATAFGTWPGLASTYGRLSAALRSVRPARRLPAQEAAVEVLIQHMLGAAVEPDPSLAAAIADDSADLGQFQAGPCYQTFLPVPLWGEQLPPPYGESPPADAIAEVGAGLPGDEKRRKARRRQADQIRRNDSLMLNRFEKILGLAELLNLNRKTEDDDPGNARKAADDLDEIAVGSHDHRPTARLALDLDIGAADAAHTAIASEIAYPEWDWKRRAYLPNHCRVIAETAAAEGEDRLPDEAALRRMRLVRRQFEALRPKRQIMPAQADGDELDLSALVRAVADRRAGGPGSDRVYSAVREAARNLSVCVLVDVSMSTDAWIEDRRVVDVVKEALLALSYGLSASGDEHAILTFTSRRRHRVNLRSVKDFDEPLSFLVTRRILALKPGDYTRMGAAVRHATRQLEQRPQRHRLLLLLTDGKPNDTDHYEGRYAIEDTRVAIHEARRAGLKVFAVTVDATGRDYLPYLFGPTAYAIFPHIARLPAALPAIYRQLTA